jgi:hypothetical protein
VTPQKKKGGARPGSGRKKNAARVAAEQDTSGELDGRKVGGKEHAQWLIEELNKIDPEQMANLHIMVSSEVLEVPDNADEEERKRLEKLEAERQIRWDLREKAQHYFSNLTFEVQGWAKIWFSGSSDLDCRKYLHDKAAHQAVRVINHVHEKPLELNVKVSIAEVIRDVRLRKQDYERNRK